ncbi:MAG TPA: nicotinamide-nucleotide adenylyltransferase [Candidatus Nanoarchaeia archaeon]|nr:nicotinamide-nucleotide adenylyltransferase [Candidatus Nanoarchaeia archaeon]
MAVGLFVGRFQPFHNGHLFDIKEALKDVDELIIAIGSSQHKNTKENPLSFEERAEMIEDVLLSNNIKNFTIFPVPDYQNDNKWLKHIETLLPEFDIVYTGNDRVISIFKKQKIYKVKKVKLLKGVSSTIIRYLIKKSGDWKPLVPKEVASFLEENRIVERIKKTTQTSSR